MPKVITLRLSDADHARLQGHAQSERMSMAAVLMRLFDQHMDKLAPTPVAKDPGKAHIRESYESHLKLLTRELVADPQQAMQWRNKLSNIQKIWGKDGTIVLPFPLAEWNALMPQPAAITPAKPVPFVPSKPPGEETPESIEEDLKRLAAIASSPAPDFGDLNFDD